MLNRRKIRLPRALLILLLLVMALFGCNDPKSDGGATSANKTSPAQSVDIDLSQKWSKTSPAINIHHIFLGEINRQGKPTGFHSRPNGLDPTTARLKRIQSKPNKAGVYTARIEVFDESSNQWKEKFSSLFPDRLSASEVLTAISHAYQNRDKSKKQPWSGPSGFGFTVQGYVLNNGKVNTAFPIYTKD